MVVSPWSIAPDKRLIPHIADPLAIHRYIRFPWILAQFGGLSGLFLLVPNHYTLALLLLPRILLGEFASPPLDYYRSFGHC